jgi:hypothetical protein
MPVLSKAEGTPKIHDGDTEIAEMAPALPGRRKMSRAETLGRRGRRQDETD